MNSRRPTIAITALMFLLPPALSFGAQRGGGQRGTAGPPKLPREAAPIDLTGYWVSVISEDWRVRMVVAQKGDWQFMGEGSAKVRGPKRSRKHHGQRGQADGKKQAP